MADRDDLVKLLINQDRVAESWIKLLVAVQAGLIVILGFAIRPASSGESSPDPLFRSAVSVIVPLFGVVFAVFVGRIVAWERKWARWFSRRITDPAMSHEPIYPTKPGVIKREPTGPVTRIFWSLIIAISAGWILVAFILKPWTPFVR